ncbi:MAG: hypothetical protein ACM3ML_26310, partial [Micromonosporaceae bacterium]
ARTRRPLTGPTGLGCGRADRNDANSPATTSDMLTPKPAPIQPVPTADPYGRSPVPMIESPQNGVNPRDTPQPLPETIPGLVVAHPFTPPATSVPSTRATPSPH